MWKHALSKLQVMWAELGDMYSETIILNYEDERIKKVEIVLEQVGSEWSKFEEIIRSEIKEQLQVKLEVASSMSGKSRRINRSGSSEGSSGSNSSSYSAKQLKVEIKQSEPSLKAKVAFSDEEGRLMIWKLECEQTAKIVELENVAKLEQLKLERELAENQAKLKEFIKTENEKFGFQDLDFQLPSDKEEDIKKIRTSANYHAKIEVPQTFTPSPVRYTTSTTISTVQVENTMTTTPHLQSSTKDTPPQTSEPHTSESMPPFKKKLLNTQAEFIQPIYSSNRPIMSTDIPAAGNTDVQEMYNFKATASGVLQPPWRDVWKK
jgi:hypothetical protein